MTVHAFVDETRRGSTYYLVCALVDPAAVTRLRRIMRELLLRGQSELHFAKENGSRRRQIVDRLVSTELFRIRIYSADCATGEENARQRCMASLAGDLVEAGAQRLVLDTRAGRDRHDQLTLRRRLGAHPSQTNVTYEHVDSRHEPLIWVADAIGWCYGAGGEWRQRVLARTESHAVT
ncbi:hypothetical protein [Tenggerimyces flavus]|uniref:DUF3800 domain-containing protein n=1 Tax=Tenggerimyces flavus TaxID=1708749 RepID=A0ABV7YQG5_9ACTN|nr:hypothetical protein [Tenggerimyces flavus]MBM7786230.1 hypothetical protein [Tenggerimyces flavus]